MVFLQFILYEYREKERCNKADTLRHANLPRRAITFAVAIEIGRLVVADFLNVEGDGHWLCHDGDSGAHEVHACYVEVASFEPESEGALILCMIRSLRFLHIILIDLRNARLLWRGLKRWIVVSKVIQLILAHILPLKARRNAIIRMQIVLVDIHVRLRLVVGLFTVQLLRLLGLLYWFDHLFLVWYFHSLLFFILLEYIYI